MRLQLESALLDKVAHFFEVYFGVVRKLSFDSHDKLTKNSACYATAKKLIIPDEFLSSLETLKKDISDYRDYQIAHEKGLRTTRPTYITGGGKVTMAVSKIYPSETFEDAKTRPLMELLENIDKYLKDVIAVVLTNRDKTNLKVNRKPQFDNAV